MRRGQPEPTPSYVVRKSAIQGRGVFAARNITKGDRIVEYLGERISHDEAQERYDDEGMRRHHTFLFSVDDELCIDATVTGNEAKYINHSCEPNSLARIIKRRIFVLASRNITAGEEILYDYWYTTDESYTPAQLRKMYPCRCGVPSCRGTLAALEVEPVKKAKKAKAAASAETVASKVGKSSKAGARPESGKGSKRSTTARNGKRNGSRV